MRVYWMIGIVIAALLAGCHWAMKPAQTQTQPIANASSGVAGIVAHTQSADRHVRNAAPHSSGEGKVLLRAASEEHQEVLAGASEVKTALAQAAGQVASLEQRIAGEQDRYARLEGRWYVAWGRRIERALWVIGIGWLICGIASILFGLGNPLSATWRTGKELTRLLPAMNLFSWLRDWLLSRRQPDQTAATSSASSVSPTTMTQG